MADSLEKSREPAPLSLIVPIFKAELGLSQSLDQALSVLSASELSYEEIVVAAEPHMAAVTDVARFPSVRLIAQEHGSSWGTAILTACAAAKHDLICTIDVHTLYAAAEIPRLVHALEEHEAAMAVGVRIGIQKPIPARRRLLSWLIDMLASDALGKPLPDVNSGFRVLRRPVLDELNGRLTAPPALPAALTLMLLAKNASLLFVPIDDEPGARKIHRGKLRETFQLIHLIISHGLEHSRRRTVSLIARMALMMLMMAGMMLMMMWMLGMLPGS